MSDVIKEFAPTIVPSLKVTPGRTQHCTPSVAKSSNTIGSHILVRYFEGTTGDINPCLKSSVFREWVKLNQTILNKEYQIQKGIPRQENDLDVFSLWLVDNIYLQVYCKGTDNIIVKEFCVEHFGYEDGASLEN